TERYKQEWAAANPGAPMGKMGLSRHVYVADTDQEAHEVAKQAYANWFKSNDELWRAFGAESLHFPNSYEAAIERGLHSVELLRKEVMPAFAEARQAAE